MSVRENLLLPFTFNINKKIPKPDDKRMVGLMQQLLLSNVALDDSAKTLSIGQQQRICFVRGLLLAPEVMLLDEPASALDSEGSRMVQEMTEKLSWERGITVRPHGEPPAHGNTDPGSSNHIHVARCADPSGDRLMNAAVAEISTLQLTVGLIFIVLAGADPVTATRYQIVVMVMLVGSTALGSFLVLSLVRRRCFGSAQQLLLRQKKRGRS